MDNIANVVWKTAVNAIPQTFLDMPITRHVQYMPRRGNLPRAMEAAETCTLSPIMHAICIRETLERFFFNRIEPATGHLLAGNHYGFRNGRSTIDAINQVVGKGNEAISGKRWKDGSKKYCLLVTLDVRNAFNSNMWKNICQALDKLDVPAHLKDMIKSYFMNRLLVYDTEGGSKEYQITGGIPQGLVFGSPLWNIM